MDIVTRHPDGSEGRSIDAGDLDIDECEPWSLDSSHDLHKWKVGHINPVDRDQYVTVADPGALRGPTWQWSKAHAVDRHDDLRPHPEVAFAELVPETVGIPTDVRARLHRTCR